MPYYTVEPPSGHVLLCTQDEDVAHLVLKAIQLGSEISYGVGAYDECQCNREL